MSDEPGTRCAALTKSGSRCKNYVQEGSAYCYVHQDAAAAPSAPAADEARRQELMAELDALVAELEATLPEAGSSPYNPLSLLTMLRQNLKNMTPEVQLGLLESFEGMTVEDLMDLETWKGLGYMMGYSARFQAEQLRERMNKQLPKPLQPDTMLQFMRKHVDRFTPDVAKGIMESLQGASREDLMDPDTWKGIWYMMNYSVQFQANQLRERLLGDVDEKEL